MTTTAFPSLLRAALARSGLRHQDVARRAGISRPYITSAASGTLPPPLRNIERLADALDLAGRERATFIIEAHLAHTAPVLMRYVRTLERQQRIRRR